MAKKSETAKTGGSGAGMVTVPGLKESKGMQGFLVLPDGEYGLECTGVKLKDSDKSPCTIWNFGFKVLDGEGDDGKALAGRRWGWRVTILGEMHPKFEEVKMGVEELKSMCLAFGVAPRGDSISPEAFQGLKARVRVGMVMGKDQNGNDRPENKVREWLQA